MASGGSKADVSDGANKIVESIAKTFMGGQSTSPNALKERIRMQWPGISIDSDEFCYYDKHDPYGLMTSPLISAVGHEKLFDITDSLFSVNDPNAFGVSPCETKLSDLYRKILHATVYNDDKETSGMIEKLAFSDATLAYFSLFVISPEDAKEFTQELLKPGSSKRFPKGLAKSDLLDMEEAKRYLPIEFMTDTSAERFYYGKLKEKQAGFRQSRQEFFDVREQILSLDPENMVKLMLRKPSNETKGKIEFVEESDESFQARQKNRETMLKRDATETPYTHHIRLTAMEERNKFKMETRGAYLIEDCIEKFNEVEMYGRAIAEGHMAAISNYSLVTTASDIMESRRWFDLGKKLRSDMTGFFWQTYANPQYFPAWFMKPIWGKVGVQPETNADNPYRITKADYLESLNNMSRIDKDRAKKRQSNSTNAREDEAKHQRK